MGGDALLLNFPFVYETALEIREVKFVSASVPRERSLTSRLCLEV